MSVLFLAGDGIVQTDRIARSLEDGCAAPGPPGFAENADPPQRIPLPAQTQFPQTHARFVKKDAARHPKQRLDHRDGLHLLRRPGHRSGRDCIILLGPSKASLLTASARRRVYLRGSHPPCAPYRHRASQAGHAARRSADERALQLPRPAARLQIIPGPGHYRPWPARCSLRDNFSGSARYKTEGRVSKGNPSIAAWAASEVPRDHGGIPAHPGDDALRIPVGMELRKHFLQRGEISVLPEIDQSALDLEQRNGRRRSPRPGRHAFGRGPVAEKESGGVEFLLVGHVARVARKATLQARRAPRAIRPAGGEYRR